MGYKAILEERWVPFTLREVEEAVGDDDVTRSKIFSQRAAGADCHDALDSQGFQGIDIGTVGHV